MTSNSHHSQTSIWPSLEGSIIPDKLYFKISEVCEITGLKQHALRYWESEFAIIKPQRTGSKQRLYRRADVENILKIKKLLHEEGFTIAGAKKFLSKEKSEGKKKTVVKQKHMKSSTDKKFILTLKAELIKLKRILEK